MKDEIYLYLNGTLIGGADDNEKGLDYLQTWAKECQRLSCEHLSLEIKDGRDNLRWKLS